VNKDAKKRWKYGEHGKKKFRQTTEGGIGEKGGNYLKEPDTFEKNNNSLNFFRCGINRGKVIGQFSWGQNNRTARPEMLGKGMKGRKKTVGEPSAGATNPQYFQKWPGGKVWSELQEGGKVQKTQQSSPGKIVEDRTAEK